MNTSIRITFDSNVWRPLVSPLIFPGDPDAGHFQTIRQALQNTLVLGCLSETIFTLEAIQRVNRKSFFGTAKLQSQATITEQPDGTTRAGFAFGPAPSHHASNSSHLTNHLQDARALNFKLLRCPRIGGVGNPDLQPTDYATDDRVNISDRQERVAKCARDIETRGWGIKHVKNIGNKYANGQTWIDGLNNAPASENGLIAKAIAEWADGDSVATHFGYGNGYFCTRDKAKAAGSASVLSQPNQAWLSHEYKISIVSPEVLAKLLTT